MERYEILKVLGVGSFGKVYLVRHHQERKLACAKMIKIKNIPRKERDVCRNEVRNPCNVLSAVRIKEKKKELVRVQRQRPRVL